MNHRFLVSCALVVMVLMALPAVGQKTWTPPRTADGKPDIQGIWTNATVTLWNGLVSSPENSS